MIYSPKRWVQCFLAAVLIGMVLACGKKGPPVTPVKLKKPPLENLSAIPFRGGVEVVAEEGS